MQSICALRCQPCSPCFSFFPGRRTSDTAVNHDCGGAAIHESSFCRRDKPSYRQGVRDTFINGFSPSGFRVLLLPFALVLTGTLSVALAKSQLIISIRLLCHLVSFCKSFPAAACSLATRRFDHEGKESSLGSFEYTFGSLIRWIFLVLNRERAWTHFLTSNPGTEST